MNRIQALNMLEAIGGDEAERLAGRVRAGPASLDLELERGASGSFVGELHIRRSFDYDSWGTARGGSRTRGNPSAAKYGWER